MTKESIIVSDRGQITLPSAMRKSLGLHGNAMLTAEQVGGKIVLTPAMVIETESYSDEQIAEWNRADALKEGERGQLLGKLKKNKPRA